MRDVGREVEVDAHALYTYTYWFYDSHRVPITPFVRMYEMNDSAIHQYMKQSDPYEVH